MPWLALQLDVEAPLAEALSDALLELGAESVTIEDADAATAAETPCYAEPGMRGPAPWPHTRVSAMVSPAGDTAALVHAAARAAGLSAAPAYSVTRIEDEDWVRQSQAQFAPLRIGRRLWIVPSWCAQPVEEGAVVVRVDPGLAFGTGTHPTTHLVLEWLEGALGARRAAQRLRVLDYGCGSGILALAAARLGATDVVAVDVDPQALETCAANARANGVAVRVGMPYEDSGGDYDLIVANILAQPLIALAPTFAARAYPGARIALSGILAEQAAQVMDAYAGAFELAVERVQEGWALLAGERR